ncbi:hypothetical protein EJF36_17070 [Bacillus sp. HMF5848]|uniref:hypothetical protein n=1 Tax=Bacillus sp. HMF5848 TaxID=2495421 RepID=UPI000F766051|nr:hypothetical protein [Bacillus sp. HMF5848]RSK28441.1 hypothetical protein EJF36_17070 [Bacillus sp. HMF5848]
MPNNEHYSDFSNVEVMKQYKAPEHTPDGPYGSPIEARNSVSHDSSKRSYSAFNYENKGLHEDIERKDPGSHRN